MRIFKDGDDRAALAADGRKLQIASNLTIVKTVVAMASARGGVGKSTLAVNLAVALAQGGRKVGLLDGDLNSPSIVGMLGMRPARRMPAADWIEPAAGPLGLRVAGIDLLNEREAPAISFLADEAPVSLVEPANSFNRNGHRPSSDGYTEALARMLGRIRFGALDILLIDLAPGLEALSRLMPIAPQANLIAVCHPSGAAARDLIAMLNFAAESSALVHGVIENMAGFSCDGCHAVRPLMPQGNIAAATRSAGVALLERLPFDPRLAESCDRGAIFIREYPEAPLTRQLIAIAEGLGRLIDAVSSPPVPAIERGMESSQR
ncbi:MAG TPA: P-loop NTPase [Candidatus Binataceae bacterium]|nr:P-loop NTPase [Candidatus Binataceae bacterium]